MMRQFYVSVIDGLALIVRKSPWPRSAHKSAKAVLSSLDALRNDVVEYSPGYCEQSDGRFVDNSWESGCEILGKDDEGGWSLGGGNNDDDEDPRASKWKASNDPTPRPHAPPPPKLIDDLAATPTAGESLVDQAASKAVPVLHEVEVWSEGFAATGESGKAAHHGTYSAYSLKQAFNMWVSEDSERAAYAVEHLDGTLSYWGCKIFDNGNDARKSFG